MRSILAAAMLGLAACSTASPEIDQEPCSGCDGGGGSAASPEPGPSPTSGAGGTSSHTSATSTGSSSSSGSGAEAPVPEAACCGDHGGLGCDDDAIESCVCEADPFCCATAWDALCVTTAQTACHACGVATVCSDGGIESNESESEAAFLPAIDDCDVSSASIAGAIDGPGDVDWYTFDGSDALGCVVDPLRTLDATMGGLRLCKYFECIEGETLLSECPSGSSYDVSPEGRPGCCGNFGFQVTSLDCADTWSDDSYVFIRVDQPSAPAGLCNQYTVDYHY